ncbi:FTS and Hook-interacting protein homolog isoform X1 [Anguilla anguilla]|uniref:FTS and Hook-interacting protein homolog isoform X1 n=1 Tax=Anguilla anguilla TaxID=7936 RepID=UPI0015AB0E5A|nr:FTS and Hook-interacting protein homolog isoform X1 [Anguilla anguilla]XP_035266524.1 FTS and Hook-interacting protein homolog isoform X1 [Anguilla anguilla]XP_035266525.1 FTS and Hook-interacting protein homolog isoform X1 [Anguilla anguilla]XP_035266526.1 FTS and Hook-interacting protein homolog isoform X1 [Anguilla anguilla]
MSWLSRLTPRGPGSRTGRNGAPSCPVTADPETCLMVFENHWRQVSWVLEQRDPPGSGAGDDLTAVRNHTDQMMCLLAEERPGGGAGAGDAAAMGPILELAVTENILDRLLQWHLRRGLDPDSQGALLKLFEMLIGRSQQPLLRHKPVLQPLLRLLAACADPQLGCPPPLESSLVLLLNQVCACVARQPAVLELLLRAGPAPSPAPGPQGPAPIPQGPTNLLIFSLLVPFIHRDGAIGQQARDALLLVMATSADNQAMARYIAENSYFCPVLATGLSALYSSLPRKIEVRGDDWHALRREDWVGVSSLVLFMNSLEFCNAVVQVSHPLVRGQLLDYVHNGFLVPVMGPALHKSSVEEMIASTAYLDLFLRSVTETALLKTFLRFILLHRHDNDTILNTLLTRISSNSRLCMVSLSLFRTLLALNCEDLMLQLVLRYLIPCTHVMLSQRRAVKETDIYGKSADRFLSLIPECCRLDTAPSSDREDDPAFWDKVPGSPTAESPVHPKPSTPSRLVLFIRQQSSGGGVSPPSGSETTPASPRGGPSPLSLDSPVHAAPEAGELETGYLAYLRDARRGIELCSWGCRDWSAPYDGEDPSPGSVPPPAPPPPPVAAETLGANGEAGADSGQQRAAVVAAARSEWGSSDRDSGEWDITISKNCISLTPRTKKRSLQREAPLLKHAPQPRPCPLPPSSQLPHPAAGPQGPQAALYNGAGQGGPCADVQEAESEVKKVKRDSGGDPPPGEAGLNGGVVGRPPGGPPTSGAKQQGWAVQGGQGQPATPLPNASEAPEPAPKPNSAPNARVGPAEPPAPSLGLESVESLIEELLERAPAGPLAGDPGVQGISIEAFHQELRELEDRVRERRGAEDAAARDPPVPTPGPGPDPTPADDRPPSPPDSDLSAAEPKAESSAPGVLSPAHPLTQPASQPYTGPFVAVLFAKLECMLQNSLYVNILLTGILAQLACYPQPLLRSFLLNTNMVFQPSVKSLIQVLGSVKNRIEAFAATQEDFPAMLRKARRYLTARGKLDWGDSPVGVPNLRRSDSLVKSRKPSLGDLLLRHTQSPTRARQAAQLALAHVRDGSQSLHSALFRGEAGGGASGVEKQAEALRVKNAVYSAVVFSEFLKELAALAQEHAVAMPFPRSQGAEE